MVTDLHLPGTWCTWPVKAGTLHGFIRQKDLPPSSCLPCLLSSRMVSVTRNPTLQEASLDNGSQITCAKQKEKRSSLFSLHKLRITSLRPASQPLAKGFVSLQSILCASPWRILFWKAAVSILTPQLTSTTCQQNNSDALLLYSVKLLKMKIIHSPVISHLGNRSVQMLVLSLPFSSLREPLESLKPQLYSIPEENKCWRLFSNQPFFSLGDMQLAGDGIHDSLQQINRNPQMHLVPAACLLLQEGIQFSKGCARSRDAGWVGMGLTGRRQAGKKDMWEWIFGFSKEDLVRKGKMRILIRKRNK